MEKHQTTNAPAAKQTSKFIKVFLLTLVIGFIPAVLMGQIPTLSLGMTLSGLFLTALILGAKASSAAASDTVWAENVSASAWDAYSPQQGYSKLQAVRRLANVKPFHTGCVPPGWAVISRPELDALHLEMQKEVSHDPE